MQLCQKSVLVTSSNMKTHLSNCKKAPRMVGRMLPLSQHSSPSASGSASVELESLDGSASAVLLTHTVAEQLGARITPAITSEMKEHLDGLFSDAIHQTCTQFDLFTHAAWRRFFEALSPNCSTPSPARISTNLLDSTYSAATMQMRTMSRLLRLW